MQTLTLARHAMACRFELVLMGEHPSRLRAAGEEALDEIARVEAQLSLFRPSSEISRLNAIAAQLPVRVTPEVFRLLKLAGDLHDVTGGAFDITVAPLVRAWGFFAGVPSQPPEGELRRLRDCVGMERIILNDREMTVQFDRPGVMLDLGAIGKGFAVEKAVHFLREAEVQCALLHGGTSTVYGLGAPPGTSGWRIAVENPLAAQAEQAGSGLSGTMHRLQSAAVRSERMPETGQGIFSVELCDSAFSVSAPSGKFFEVDGRVFGHVIDPTTGMPGRAGALAAVMLPSATETDALATALLVLGTPGLHRLKNARPMGKGWFVDSELRVITGF
jgi:FAD:protein FMN transferase